MQHNEKKGNKGINKDELRKQYEEKQIKDRAKALNMPLPEVDDLGTGNPSTPKADKGIKIRTHLSDEIEQPKQKGPSR